MKLHKYGLLSFLLLCLISSPAYSEDPVSQPPPPPPADQNLLALGSGAFVINEVASYDNWEPLWMFDERTDTGWASAKGRIGPQDFIIQLAEKSEFSSFEFSTASADELGSAAKDIAVSISDEGPTAGYEEILHVTLAESMDGQTFNVKANKAGRFLKIQILSNYGSAEYSELMEVRGMGKQLTKTPSPDFSGTYSSRYGTFHLLHKEGRVAGCYDYREGKLRNAGFEGRVLRFTWEERESNKLIIGPAIMVFSPSGDRFIGVWWFEGKTDKRGETWHGKKTSNEVGRCKHWSGPSSGTFSGGSGSAELQEQFVDSGRVREYGILFDSDSASINSESFSRLDDFVALAKANPNWNFTIEGHTDSTATRSYNQGLSEARARSVKDYLVNHGISTSRLESVGFGPDKPVAGNGTSFGRAQNRRVEFVLRR